MIKRAIIVTFILTIPLSIFIPHLDQFAFPFHSKYSDIIITHYPNIIFLRNSLIKWKEIPLWSNLILSGYPFSANPLSGLWYLPGLLAILLPIPLGINLLFIIHLLWGGLGMFLFLLSEKYNNSAALIGALIFELFPKIFAHIAAGHLTLLYAITWTPWLLLSEKVRLNRSAKNKIFFMPGIIIGIIFLADVRWTAYSGILLLAYSTHIILVQNELIINLFKLKAFLIAWKRSYRSLLAWFAGFILQAFIAVLIASPLLLPLIQYNSLSTRSLITPSEAGIYSLPITHLLGLFIPNLRGSAEWIIYPGALSLLLFIWIIGIPELRSQVIFWIGIVIFTLLYSIGAFSPLIELVSWVPGIILLRVPTRVMFIGGFAFSVIAAAGIQSLLKNEKMEIQTSNFISEVSLISVMSFIILLVTGTWIMTGYVSPEFLLGAISISIFTILILLRKNGYISNGVWIYTIVSLLILDLLIVNYSYYKFYSKRSVFSDGNEVASYLSEQKGEYRIYSPSYSLPQLSSAIYDLELVDGVDPMQLISYVKYMETATGIPIEGYSVTLPPFASGDPDNDNQAFSPDIEKLGLLNTKYIASEFNINSNGLNLLKTIGKTRIYENPQALPRAWVQHLDTELGKNIISIPTIIQSPNHIELHAKGPGLLVLSEINYPGWYVIVDGCDKQLCEEAGIFRGVILEEGEHHVEFIYHPVLVYIGVILSLLTWPGLLLVIPILNKNEKQKATK